MDVMRWSEPSQQVLVGGVGGGGGNGNGSEGNGGHLGHHHHHHGNNGAGGGGGAGPGGAAGSAAGAPTIKNHSVTHFNGYLYCFGGYDGRRNHMTLLLYSIAEQRWIRPHHVVSPPSAQQQAGDPPSPVDHHHHHQHQHQQHQRGGNNNPAAAAAGLHADHAVGGGVVPGGASYLGDPTIVVQGTPPPGRNGHSATLAVDPDDDDVGRIIIIGGWLGTGPLAASDMHVLDVSAGGRQLRWYQPSMKGTPPGPCNMHSADYVSARREVYVFRGGNGREYLNDLHALSTDTLAWRRVETVGTVPQQRANHSSAMLEETAELFIFGGWNGTERLNDIHILDTASSTWTCPHVAGVLPHPRAGMTLTALRGRLFLFGGSGTSAKCFQDLQILDRSEMAWLDVTTQYEEDHHHHHHHGLMAAAGRHHPHRYDHELHHHHHDADDVARFRFGGGPRSHHDDGGSLFRFYGGGDNDYSSERPQQQGEGVAYGGGDGRLGGYSSGSARTADWQGRDNGMGPSRHYHQTLSPHQAGDGGGATSHLHHSNLMASPNPNDEDTVPTVLVHGRGPGRRAGHTATAVGRKIYIFGGSCGSDYLNDFFVLDTDPPPVAVVTEPTSLQQVERRLAHFFNDEEFSDVTFMVQGQPVYGHKMVLSIVSDCFRAMFTTGFRESAACQIEIPDCSYQAFLAVMEYIYTGGTNWPNLAVPPSPARTAAALDSANNSQDGSAAAGDTLSATDHHRHNHNHAAANNRNLACVVEMLELADRFFLDHLKQICETLLQPAVTAETVEYLLSVAQKTNAAQLQEICEHFLRNREGPPRAT